MKINKNITLIIVCIIMLNQSCIYDRFDTRLKIKNLSGVSITIRDGLGLTPEYPSVNQTEYYLEDTIAVGETKSIMQNNPDWPRYVRKSKNKKLNLFIYNLDTLKRYNNINFLIKNQKYKIITLTENQLDSLHWNVKIEPMNW